MKYVDVITRDDLGTSAYTQNKPSWWILKMTLHKTSINVFTRLHCIHAHICCVVLVGGDGTVRRGGRWKGREGTYHDYSLVASFLSGTDSFLNSFGCLPVLFYKHGKSSCFNQLQDSSYGCKPVVKRKINEWCTPAETDRPSFDSTVC